VSENVSESFNRLIWHDSKLRSLRILRKDDLDDMNVQDHREFFSSPSPQPRKASGLRLVLSAGHLHAANSDPWSETARRIGDREQPFASDRLSSIGYGATKPAAKTVPFWTALAPAFGNCRPCRITVGNRASQLIDRMLGKRATGNPRALRKLPGAQARAAAPRYNRKALTARCGLTHSVKLTAMVKAAG